MPELEINYLLLLFTVYCYFVKRHFTVYCMVQHCTRIATLYTHSLSNQTDHFGVTTIEILDLSHLYPLREHPGEIIKFASVGICTQIPCVAGGLST